jgi:hypothetical protein
LVSLLKNPSPPSLAIHALALDLPLGEIYARVGMD